MFYWQGNNAKNFNYGLKIDLLAVTYYETQTKEICNSKTLCDLFSLFLKLRKYSADFEKQSFIYLDLSLPILVNRDFFKLSL